LQARRAQRKANAAEGDDIIREAFTVFDTDKDGLIAPAEIATVIRALGKNPTQREADEIAREAG
jgi:Ca2+-binding EF-hand superfamily protein